MSSFGLTGGIASGKSTVAAIFAELGARIIDADKLGHDQLRLGTPTFEEILSRFGPGVLNREGEIDRRRLGEIVFADPDKRATLNSIVHPAIMARRQELTRLYHAEDRDSVVISDAALIYEAHIESWFLGIVVVWCAPEQQLERLLSKAGLSQTEAERRIHAQMSPDEKRRRADFVIDTSGSIGETWRQVEELYPQLKRLAEQKSGVRSQK
jgi:dephospho-CoA kinase